MVTVVTPNPRVMLSGMPVATMASPFVVGGCPFTLPAPKPQPCVIVTFTTPAVRVMVMGSPVILQTSTGICQSAEQIPQGPPTVVQTQPRVVGS